PDAFQLLLVPLLHVVQGLLAPDGFVPVGDQDGDVVHGRILTRKRAAAQGTAAARFARAAQPSKLKSSPSSPDGREARYLARSSSVALANVRVGPLSFRLDAS